MEGYDYDAAASTIKIEDITSNKINRDILRRLKEDDPEFDEVWVTNARDDEFDYCPEGSLDIGWLGYFIGKNKTLKKLYLESSLQGFNGAIETFCEGVNSNRSIRKIEFRYMDLSWGEIFQSLLPFFENNNNLCELVVEDCQFGPGCAHQLSLALRDCNKSLKVVWLNNIDIGGDAPFAEIIEALSKHLQLESLDLRSIYAGRKKCTALVNLLRSTTTELCTLNLCHNIDDEGIDALVAALARDSNLRFLDLSQNREITARGCQSLAALLENPNTNLERLIIYDTNVGDEGAFIFANALARNKKLKILDLAINGITAEGWSSFSKVLCDTSSVTNTYRSNHTLEELTRDHRGFDPDNLPSDVRTLLAVNMGSDNKRQVAMKKILKHHQHFDMQPFFELDLKVLPLVVDWFERARSVEAIDKAGIENRKLDAIYQFIRAMPDVF